MDVRAKNINLILKKLNPDPSSKNDGLDTKIIKHLKFQGTVKELMILLKDDFKFHIYCLKNNIKL
jgi:hypothetical protein